MNQKTQKTKHSSAYKGIHFYKKLKKWGAKINIDGTKYNLGYYDSEEDAATAYNKKAKELFGQYARLNEVKNV